MIQKWGKGEKLEKVRKRGQFAMLAALVSPSKILSRWLSIPRSVMQRESREGGRESSWGITQTPASSASSLPGLVRPQI